MLCSNSFTFRCMRINTNYRTSKYEFIAQISSTQMSFFLMLITDQEIWSAHIHY